ncbi:MAG TPA: hypothetical protein VML01_12000 [Bryobacterales bacterium]|nr:hypothetical protein [Bryobacterales bacterium]
MRFWDKVNHYIATTRGMQEYLRQPPTRDWRGRIERNLENRGEVWVDTLRRTVFSSSAGPYRRMFELADCTFDDLSASVDRYGVERTLEKLRSAGVHLSHDEFKGKMKIVRQGEEIPASPSDFANPLAQGWLAGRTSGSRSGGTVTLTGNVHLDYLTGYAALNVEEFGMREGPYVIVRPILPSIAGMYFCLFHSRLDCEMGPWFAYGGSGADSLHYRALTNYIVGLARVRGQPAPFPRFLPQNDFAPVAAWIAAQRKRHRRCTLQAVASVGARIAAAAKENDLDVGGTIFVSGGEALTPGKRRICESVGMEVHPAYWVSEIGQIGHACRAIREGNAVHVFTDGVAVITQTRLAPFSDQQVESLQLTSLLPHSPYVLINCDMDDAGVLEDSPCDCTFGRVGFTRRIRDISSYGKLTGLGVTLVGTDVLRILEEDLPVRIGGAPSDYQLVQQEAGNQTELTLRVNPRLQVALDDVRELFLERLSKCYGGVLATRVWKHTEAFRVISGVPIETKGGKTLPLHITKPEE